jgi:2-iminobutanoate/2-iminopropanoate deaminase
VQARQVGSLLFLSGQLPLTKDGVFATGGMEQQTTQVIDNIRAIAHTAGAALTDVVKVTAFLTDLQQFDAYNSAYIRAFGDHKPARTTIEVSKLPKDALVEIECIIAVPISQ